MSDDSKTPSGISRRRFVQMMAGAAGLPLLPGCATTGIAKSSGVPLQLGRNQPFDFDWKFSQVAGDGSETLSMDDNDWRSLDLPHDWSIEDLPAAEGAVRIGPFDKKAIGGTATGFAEGGEGWYRKHFRVDGLPQGSRLQVLFDGIYTESDIWLNGEHLGRHVHGYTPFGYDLTPHIHFEGDNVLAVRVRNLGKNSRWYSGSGIYRGVTLDVVAEASHIDRWGVGIVTQQIRGTSASIQIETRVVEAAADLTLITRILDASGKPVGEISSRAADVVQQSIELGSARLWSPETPVLYTAETLLLRGDRTLDRVVTPFGVRIVSFDASKGIQINGVPLKLRGGCVHHDNGLLGAVAFPDAEERRVLLLKARGYNAIRSSHYPASRAFADACDRHGMLLIEEAFDMWHAPKNPDDYSVSFKDHWPEDLRAMVQSARNHPSVIMWSIGNEIPDRSTPEGIEIQWNLANEVHRLDPSRPVTAAVHGFAGRPLIPDESTARAGLAGVPDESGALFLDVVGYNYKLDRYEPDHAHFPRRVMFGSESYPKQVFENWAFIEAHPYVIGDFVWTAMDYLGEAGIGNAQRTKSSKPGFAFPTWPWVVSNCGDIDLIGGQKPQSRARDVAWGLSPLEMAVERPVPEGLFEHVSLWGWPDECQSWTWPGSEGKPLAVRTYTKGDRVELSLNGKVIESKTRKAADSPRLEFEVPYEAGMLEAVAFKHGKEIGRRRFETVGALESIRLKPESSIGKARRNGLSYVTVELVDSAGRVVPDARNKVRLSVKGPAQLIGFGSANAQATGSFQSAEAETFDGRALAIFRLKGEAGSVVIEAQCEQLLVSPITLDLI